VALLHSLIAGALQGTMTLINFLFLSLGPDAEILSCRFVHFCTLFSLDSADSRLHRLSSYYEFIQFIISGYK
jgi:hypothetical protein